jgi:hypothetical protein
MHGRFYDRPTVGAWQFGGTAYVAIGEAWNPFPGTPRDPGIGQVRRATDEIMARVAALLEAARAAAG